jgi:hypothetical protein
VLREVKALQQLHGAARFELVIGSSLGFSFGLSFSSSLGFSFGLSFSSSLGFSFGLSFSSSLCLAFWSLRCGKSEWERGRA